LFIRWGVISQAVFVGHRTSPRQRWSISARRPSAREGKRRLGRPPVPEEVQERIRAALAEGMSVRKAAARFKVNPSTVQNVKRPFVVADIGERTTWKG
jgi:DNA invertase Pin-like site-specific DNA recombinase